MSFVLRGYRGNTHNKNKTRNFQKRHALANLSFFSLFMVALLFSFTVCVSVYLSLVFLFYTGTYGGPVLDLDFADP